MIVHTDTVELCGASLTAAAHASLKSPNELDAAFRDLGAACRAKPCSNAIVVDVHEAADVSTVISLLDRARAAGFERAALDGAASCKP
jgi:hypothetical protein